MSHVVLSTQQLRDLYRQRYTRYVVTICQRGVAKVAVIMSHSRL